MLMTKTDRILQAWLKERVLEEKSPIADYLICMTCGAHIAYWMMPLHYESLHPEATNDTD